MNNNVWKRLVGSRFSGMIVFRPVSNDHSAAVLYVIENSNAGSGSNTTTHHMGKYYSRGTYINYRWNDGY